MILKALYDYYHRSGNLPIMGMELKEIGFIIVIDKCGNFLRFEDRRIDKKSAQQFLVKKSVGRSSAPLSFVLPGVPQILPAFPRDAGAAAPRSGPQEGISAPGR